MNPLLPARRLPSKNNVLSQRISLPSRRLLRQPQPQHHFHPSPSRQQHTYPHAPSRLPRFAQPSIWTSIIPRFLRSPRSSPTPKPASTPSKPKYNSSTYFIWIYILIGSQAIRILGLKHASTNNARVADLKLAKLREVIEKLHRGEEVDVEKILGTGEEDSEREWEEALRELQREERIWQDGSRRKREERERREQEAEGNSPVNQGGEEGGGVENAVKIGAVPPAPGFY